MQGKPESHFLGSPVLYLSGFEIVKEKYSKMLWKSKEKPSFLCSGCRQMADIKFAATSR